MDFSLTWEQGSVKALMWPQTPAQAMPPLWFEFCMGEDTDMYSNGVFDLSLSAHTHTHTHSLPPHSLSILSLSLSLSLSLLTLSFSPSISVASLKSQLHCANSVSPQDLYLVLPGGKTPLDSDLAMSCLQSWNTGTMYAFTTAVDPSFKMIRSTNSSVSRLSESYVKQQA